MSRVEAGQIGSDNEPQRLAAVKRYDVLDTPPDGAFDRITAIAARKFGVPIAIISIVDHDRIWFKSHHGLEATQISRDPGLCASAILADEPYLLTDASRDPRALANPLVAGEFGLRFYAAAPLRTYDGYNLGTLCVIDKAARTVTPQQIEDLKDLASVVMDQLELRLSARKAVAQAQLMTKEIDHRVMNSLQFASSLLRIQSRQPCVTDAASELDKAANRIGAVARVHRHFYSHEGGETSCIEFLRRLCADLSSVVGQPVSVSGHEGNVPTVMIQPIGLLVTELVMNAGKHGGGKCEVIFTVNGGRTISVTDDGPGVPPGFDLEASNHGLGMKVIAALVKQLQGKLSVQPNPTGRGSQFTITIPGSTRDSVAVEVMEE